MKKFQSTPIRSLLYVLNNNQGRREGETTTPPSCWKTFPGFLAAWSSLLGGEGESRSFAFLSSLLAPPLIKQRGCRIPHQPFCHFGPASSAPLCHPLPVCTSDPYLGLLPPPFLPGQCVNFPQRVSGV